MSFDPALVRVVNGLTVGQPGAAFVFATSGLSETPLRRYTRNLAGALTGAGFQVAPEVHHCRGLDTMGSFGLIGGVNRGRPSDADLAAAEDFARRLLAR